MTDAPAPALVPIPPGLRPPRRRRLLWIIVGFVALGTALAVGNYVFWGIRYFRVTGGAMSPTLEEGQRMLVEGLSFRFRDPRRGEIVVFRTDNLKRDPKPGYHVKRVVGLPGETLRIKDGHLLVNGTVVPIATSRGELRFKGYGFDGFLATPSDEYRLAADEYFVFGDNVPSSKDSRWFGGIRRADILGRVMTAK